MRQPEQKKKGAENVIKKLDTNGILQECRKTTVKAGGILFQYCPAWNAEKPYKLTIPRRGYAYLSEAEILETLGNVTGFAEIMR